MLERYQPLLKDVEVVPAFSEEIEEEKDTKLELARDFIIGREGWPKRPCQIVKDALDTTLVERAMTELLDAGVAVGHSKRSCLFFPRSRGVPVCKSLTRK